MSNFHVIIPAGGSSQRMGYNKLLHKFAGKQFSAKPVLIITIEKFFFNENVKSITIACPKAEIENYQKLLSDYFDQSELKILMCIEGGNTRQESVKNSINYICDHINSESDFILIHDAARCLLAKEDLNNLYELALKHESVSAGSKLVDTIKKTDAKGIITGSINRENTWKIETPQIFRAKDIINAHKKAKNNLATDDVSLVQDLINVYMYQTKFPNFKFTNVEDVLLFKAVFSS